MKTKTYVDQYIEGFRGDTRKKLLSLTALIRKLAPKAEETIGYGIPTFKLEGNLVHFAAFKNHIGFYPGADGIAQFKDELAVYKNAKGSVQFPLDKPLPLTLIGKIVKFRVKQNLEKAVEKKSKKQLNICPRGHRFFKSSDCPVCPVCEKEKQTDNYFVPGLKGPARRALENNGIRNLKQLSARSEKEILAFHGMGPSSMPFVQKALKLAGLKFKT